MAEPIVIQPGCHDGIPFETYAESPGVSVSRLKLFAQAPAKARFGGFKDTPAMKAGSLLHTAILEPHALEQRFHPTSLEREGTKAWIAEQEAAEGKVLTKQEAWDKALRQRDALLSHPTASLLLTPALAVEQSMWWWDEDTGLLLRGRCDGIHREMRAVVDVKTAESASVAGFTKAVRKWKYDWQAPHYMNGVKQTEGWYPDAFIFVVVESEAPHLVACYELHEDTLSRGAEEVSSALRQWDACEKAELSGTPPEMAWPGYDTGIIELNLEE